MRRGVLVCADVPNRLVGILLDAILLSLLAFLGAAALSLAFGPLVRFDLDAYTATVDARLAVANAGLTLLLGGVYFVGSYLLLDASPGHRLLAMRLRSADGAAGVGLRSAVVRWALLAGPFGVASTILSAPASGVAGALVVLAAVAWYALLLVTTALHPARQGLHDRLAGTLMVKAAPPLPAAAEPRGA